jgi:O-antigen/teichoic acid export membrane protein
MNKFEKKVTESQILEQPLAINHELEIVAKGAGIAFSGKVIGTGVKFITQVFIARLLGSKLLGIYSLGIVIHEVAALFSRIGLLHGALRYVSIHHGMEDSRRLKGVLVYAICLPWLGGLIIGTGLFLTSGYVAREVFGKPELALVLRVFSIALPFWASIIVTARSTTGFQTTKYLVYIKEYFQPLMNLLLVVVLCSIGLGLFGATLAWTLSVILGLAIAIYFVGKIFPPFLQKDVKPVFEGKKLIKYSLPLVF